jgi:hypothetical protein
MKPLSRDYGVMNLISVLACVAFPKNQTTLSLFGFYTLGCTRHILKSLRSIVLVLQGQLNTISKASSPMDRYMGFAPNHFGQYICVVVSSYCLIIL